MKTLKTTMAGVATAALLAFGGATPAKADLIQLGFILDSSGSIGSTNWNTIRTGLANAINTLIPVGGADTYEISVVTFSGGVGQTIGNVLVTDATARTNLANSIAALNFIGGLTNYAAAFTAMSGILDNTANADFTYVNFATDGDPTTGGTGVNEKNAMIAAAGVDNISIEAIGTGVDAANLINNFCFPQPCDTVAPFNFDDQGFFIQVANADAYVDAIENKIRIVTRQVPEPATLLLLGAGLLGLGLVRRRA